MLSEDGGMNIVIGDGDIYQSINLNRTQSDDASFSVSLEGERSSGLLNFYIDQQRNDGILEVNNVPVSLEGHTHNNYLDKNRNTHQVVDSDVQFTHTITADTITADYENENALILQYSNNNMNNESNSRISLSNAIYCNVSSSSNSSVLNITDSSFSYHSQVDGEGDGVISMGVNEDRGAYIAIDGDFVSIEGHKHPEYSTTGHTHTQYIPLTGGTMNGVLAVNARLKINSTQSQSNFGYLRSVAATTDSGITPDYNNGLLYIGSSTGRTSSYNATWADKDAISVYDGIVGVGKAYTYQELNNAKSNNIKLVVDGNVTANAYYESSDERLKTFGDDIKVDFEKLSKLRKSYFTFNEDPNKQHLGVSAQEIKEIYPEIVSEDENGYLSVDYAKLSVVALKAVDKLYEEVSEIKGMLKEIMNNK